MPFQRADGKRLDRIHLAQRAPATFQLLEPFSYLEPGRPEEDRIWVRMHDPKRPAKGANATDLASVPPFIWGPIASYGRHTAPELLHDQHWWESLNPDPKGWIAKRREADELFRTALRDNRTSALRSALLFSAVSIERYWGPRRWQASAMSAQNAAGVVAVNVSAPGLVGWVGMLLAVLPAIAGLASGRRSEMTVAASS